MDSPIFFSLILLCCPILFINGVQCARNLREEYIERKFNRTNKVLVTTIQNNYGDAYNCIDIYKQHALDHPLLRNHTIDNKILSTPFYNELSPGHSDGGESLKIKRNGDMCPIGTTSIRIISKDDIFRRRQVLEAREEESKNQPNTFLAIARTKSGPRTYAGARGYLSLHCPKIVGQQYSGGRIKLQAGSDSIEAGWRVDPSLYGDSQPHFYVRTDVGKVHYYNTLCPGFIHTHPKWAVDFIIEDCRTPGGDLFELGTSIIRDKNTGNWNLLITWEEIYTRGNELIGYWPRNILNGLKGMANHIEWGGVAHSSPGAPLPPMGFGNHPIGNIEFDAYVREIRVLDDGGKDVDPTDIEIYEDNSRLYSAINDKGEISQIYEHTILYGGPGH